MMQVREIFGAGWAGTDEVVTKLADTPILLDQSPEAVYESDQLYVSARRASRI